MDDIDITVDTYSNFIEGSDQRREYRSYLSKEDWKRMAEVFGNDLFYGYSNRQYSVEEFEELKRYIKPAFMADWGDYLDQHLPMIPDFSDSEVGWGGLSDEKVSAFFGKLRSLDEVDQFTFILNMKMLGLHDPYDLLFYDYVSANWSTLLGVIKSSSFCDLCRENKLNLTALYIIYSKLYALGAWYRVLMNEQVIPDCPIHLSTDTRYIAFYNLIGCLNNIPFHHLGLSQVARSNLIKLIMGSFSLYDLPSNYENILVQHVTELSNS